MDKSVCNVKKKNLIFSLLQIIIYKQTAAARIQTQVFPVTQRSIDY